MTSIDDDEDEFYGSDDDSGESRSSSRLSFPETIPLTILVDDSRIDI